MYILDILFYCMLILNLNNFPYIYSSLVNYHIVEVEAFGFPREDGSRFHVHTIRRNPADLGEVTGQATYAAYFGSLKSKFVINNFSMMAKEYITVSNKNGMKIFF